MALNLVKDTQPAKVYLSAPHMSGKEMQYIESAFNENWIAPLGPNVNAFEKAVADYAGMAHAAALNTGTAALHLAVKLMEVQPGDLVFCSSFTFSASANPIVYEGGTPVFIDAEPESWNMSPTALESAFKAAEAEGKRPKAVIVANIYGQSARYDEIRTICDRFKTPIIEDAAESLGATYNGQKSGSFGDISIFSFNGNKIITTSGGGTLQANDEALVEKARYLSTQARQPAAHYEHTELGYNYRLSNILAGVGIGQMEVLDTRVAQRRQIFTWYEEKLADCADITWMPDLPNAYSTHWLTACVFKDAAQKERVIARLVEENIEARPVWKPLHMQPVFSACDMFSHEDKNPLCEDIFERGACLPSSSFLEEADIERIVGFIKEGL